MRLWTKVKLGLWVGAGVWAWVGISATIPAIPGPVATTSSVFGLAVDQVTGGDRVDDLAAPADLVQIVGNLPTPAPMTGNGPVERPTGPFPVVGAMGDGADIVDVGHGVEVHESIAEDIAALLAHAHADGIELWSDGGGWRSHQRQHELRRINGCPDGWTHTDDEDPDQWAGSLSCRIPTARPGRSRHETGLAIDFAYGDHAIGSRQSVAFKWLDANAAAYGLQNFPKEPWHWSVDGK